MPHTDAVGIIELTPEIQPPVARRRQFSGLVVGLVTALGLAGGLAVSGYRLHASTPPVPEVRINVGVSPYPTPATASWRGADGVVHPIDIWAGQQITAAAVEVTVAAARLIGAPAQCDLYINGQVVDLATIGPQDQVVVCSWTASTPAR